MFEGELTLRVGKEAITFNLDQTSRYSASYNDMTANQIDVIDMACEEYSQEVLGFSDVIASGNPTPYYDPIFSTTSPTLTPFGNTKSNKSSIDEPPEVELKDLTPHLEYAFLEDLSVEEKIALITVLKSHKRAIAWKLSDINEFLNNLDENIQKIIKEQVKEQVKVQVSKILSKIEKTVNEHLEAEVLTRSSNSSKTSYAVAADLSEIERKKILIEKMESNKSIDQSDEQRNLYKALVDAYECDKIILDTYGDTVTLKRRRDDTDKDEELSAGSDRGSKRRKEGKEPESTSAPKEKATKTTGNNKRNLQLLIMLGTRLCQLLTEAFNSFLMNRLKVDTLTLELLVGPTYELMKGSCNSLLELEFFLEEVNNNLEYLRGGAFSRKYTTSVTKTKAADYGYIKWIEDLFYGFAINRESARDVYSKSRIIAVTELQIVEWHDYKHLDWITNVHKKHRHSTACERSLTRCQKLPKKLNLTKPDTYRFDLKSKEAYTAYSNLRGLIYQNKDNQNGLMRSDELHKFSDGTLNDVRTTLDDRLKGIRMKYLPQAIWRKSDKEIAATMIQAIDK
nr:reverse transcriptase domain-containing protein [Tanacetum cinerariifolium]